MSNKQSNRFGAGGKGYYIALILCAAAIGLSGYLYYRNADQNHDRQTGSDVTAGATQNDPEQDIQAVATGPVTTKPPVATKPVEKKPIQTASPVDGQTVAGYAMDCLSYNETTRDWRVHNGIDIGAEAGTQVSAAADGTVYTVYEDETMGNTVVIRHEDGYTTRYCSLADDVLVSPGDTVTMGQAIGSVGDTALLESAIGCHVHFSVSQNDEPVDPAAFLNME